MPMVQETLVVALLGLLLSIWTGSLATAAPSERDEALAERLEELERGLVVAREEGNEAEVAEIKALMKGLREAAAEGNDERGDGDEAELRERLEELKRELKLARETGNDVEVDEIEALMARLASRTWHEETYFAAKARLFLDHLNPDVGIAVLNADARFAMRLTEVIERDPQELVRSVQDPVGSFILLSTAATSKKSL